MDRASWCQEAANFNRSQHGHTGNTLQANALARAVCHSSCTVPRACTLQVMPRLLPTLPQPSVDSVKKNQSSVGIRVAACRRSLPQYTPLGSVTTIHVWQQMIADDIFKTPTFTFVGGGNTEARSRRCCSMAPQLQTQS